MSLAAGAHIGPYEVLACLGAGGMGVVYCVRDPRLDRSVAIKVLTSSQRATPAELERFQREARAIARVSHPNICTVHDVGQEEGVPFLVMELLEGDTLAERLRRGPIPIDAVLAIATQIAEALNAAHRKDVIHRDLKPSNVMLTASGVKLLDFGLAKLRDGEYGDIAEKRTESVHLTDQGTVLGTLPYMAPEQVEGRTADARTDIFALGVVLYEMTTGRAPFHGTSRASLAAAILTHDPPAISSRLSTTPTHLDRVVTKCLSKDPDRRWQNASDLATELRWIAERGSEQSVGITRAARPGRRGFLMGGLGAVVLAAGALAGTMAYTARRVSVAEYAQVTYRRGVVSSARFTPDGRSFVYSASWEGQPYGMFLGRPESPDARNLGLQEARILAISRAGEMGVLFGPQNIERAFGVRTLARIPMAGGARRDLLDGVVDADWIPGTDRVAVIRDPGGNRPWTVEFPAGTKVHEARAAWSLRVSPDGSRIAFFEGPLLFDSSPEAMVTVIDRSGHKSTLSKNWSGLGLAWAPSGTEVWFTGTHGGVSDTTVPTSDESRTGPPWLQAVSLAGVERTVQRAPDWLVLHDIAPDGRVLLTRNTIRIGMSCQPPGETTERDLSWLVASFARDLSSDGRTVIFSDALGGRTASGNPMVFSRSLDGSDAVALGEGAAQALSPDGKWVLAGLKGGLVLLPTGAGSMLTLPKGSLVRIGGGAWLSDSKRIVLVGGMGNDRPRIYVQEIPAGTPRAITPEGVGLVRASVRDDHSILGRYGDRWLLYPIEGGVAQPVAALTVKDFPIQWSDNRRFLYTIENIQGGPRSSSVDVFRVELSTGRRVAWKTLAPADRVGVESNRFTAAIAPDGGSYCYSFTRRLGDLFVVDGLK